MSVTTPPVAKGHRWYAASYDFLTRWAEAKVFSRYRPGVAGEAPGEVLEIGAGTGATFAYYRALERLVAAEPDPFMLRRAEWRAEQLELHVELCQWPGGVVPFAAASFDTVVSTVVLCTVVDPARALAEVKRVLRPSGTLRFIEHVRADGLLEQVQDFVTPAWRWAGAGCHPNRRTADSIEAAGFEIVERQERALALTPLIVGVARPR